LAKIPSGPKRPAFAKTPFGGVPTKSKPGPLNMLPGRAALDQLTKGNPSQRSILEFGSKTPIGSGAPNSKVIKNSF